MLLDNLQFVSSALQKLPANEFTVEERIEAIRKNCYKDNFATWVVATTLPCILCVCVVTTTFTGKSFGIVWALVATPSAPTKQFAESVVYPWFRTKGIDKIRAYDVVLTKAKGRWFGSLGFDKLAEVWQRKI